ncbi:MAG: replicative DNA helicase [Bradymonadia bacterium]
MSGPPALPPPPGGVASPARHLTAADAELAVLGGVLLDNFAIDRVADKLKAEDFHTPAYGLVFKHMLSLSEARQPIDPVTLSTAMEQAGELEPAGGMEALIRLNEAVATAVNIEHHAQIVSERAEIRRLISTAGSIIEKANSGEYEDTSRLFDEAQQKIFEVGQKQQTKSFTAMKDGVKEVIDEIRKAFETKTAITGTPTGFQDLDHMTAGFHPGDLIILAARPAMGKTTLALNIATNAAVMGKVSVAVFSLEMPTAQLVTRLLASQARVESKNMKTGHLSDEDLHRILQAVKVMKDWSIFIDDTASISVMECRAKCRRLASDPSIPPLGLIVVDYLQLMKGPPHIRSREQEISDISRNLKGMAKELGVPVVALSQLNRGLESRPNKRPIMSDLRESGAIEQDADIIMFVYRDEVYNEDSPDKGIAELLLSKHRAGSTGTIRLKFFRQWTRFDNLVEDPGATGPPS